VTRFASPRAAVADRTPLTVTALVAEPELAMRLTRAEAAGLLAAAMLRLASPDSASASRDGSALLTAEEVGERLGLTPKQVYRRCDRWPFTRRLGPKTLRFDAAGLERYLGRNGMP
jgi:hypothetical protein